MPAERPIMRVRDATPSDADAIRDVHGAAIAGLAPSAYTDEQVEAWGRGVESADYGVIEHEEFEFVVAEAEDEVLAFGSLRLATPDGYESPVDAEVTAVYAHPSAAARASARRCSPSWSAGRARRASTRSAARPR